MAELFAGYKGGSFGSVLPSMINAAMQRQNTPPRYNIPSTRITKSQAVASNALTRREDMLAPLNYKKFQEKTLGTTLANINDLRNMTETETVQIPIETPPPGGDVKLEEYRRLQGHETNLANMITDLNTQSNKLEKKLTSFPKTGMTPEQEAESKGLIDEFNAAQDQKSEAELTLANVNEALRENILAGGGEPSTEVHTAHREVPANIADKREAAMKMVSANGGKLGGIEMAKLYAEIDRLYPTDKVAETHRTQEGEVLGWKPSGLSTFVQKKPNAFNPALVLGGGWEETGMSIDQYGQPRYNYAPTETPRRKVFFPGKPAMYAASDESAAEMNSHLKDQFAINKSIDRILEIAESVQWDENWFDKLNPNVRAEVQAIQKVLVGKLRVPLVGPGVVSNFDYQQLLDAINDPTAFEFQNLISGGQSSVVKLNVLKEQINNSLLDKAAYAGLTVPGSKYRLPEEFRRFDDIATARYFGFQAGDIVHIKGVPGRGSGYTRIRLKPPVSGTAIPLPTGTGGP